MRSHKLLTQLTTTKPTNYYRRQVLVEKPAQKRILVGAGGAALKELSSLAREAIEAFVGKVLRFELLK